jgi:integrase
MEREFYYVKFKDNAGKYGNVISTRQKTKAAAIATAYDWLKNGIPTVKGGSISLSVMDALKQVQTLSEADFICRELKRRGLLKIFVITGSKQDTGFPDYLQNFWDYETSPYVKEKLRKNHGIHRNYTVGQRLIVKKYWVPFFEGRILGSITRQDIEDFIDVLSERKLSAGRKNTILKAGTIPLRWAFSKEMIEKNIIAGIIWFSGDAKERQILTPEVVEAVFKVEWRDERARLANMLAAVTGLRSGEIRGLRVQDLGEDCLYVRHSWNCRDRLKTTKNNDCRTVEVPFSGVIRDLLILAEHNPHGMGVDSYVFWAEKSSEKPMDGVLFVRGLHAALEKTGMSREAANAYVFHGWRHFFTAYMRDKLNEKLLQSQTGHKTVPMLNHYADQLLIGDRERIRRAQRDAFGALLPQSEFEGLS